MENYNFNKCHTTLSVEETIISLNINGSFNTIYVSAKIPNLLINGHHNKIKSQINARLMQNVVINGSNNVIYSQYTNFNCVSNGENNKINDQVVSMIPFGNHFNFYNNFDGSSFNININNGGLRNIGSQIENLVNMVTGSTHFTTHSNNINFTNNYQNDEDDSYEEEEEEEQEEYEDNDGSYRNAPNVNNPPQNNFDEEAYTRELIKQRKNIILNFDEFQFKHADKYIKKNRIEDKCAICLEKFIRTDIVKRFACQEHIFHKKCLAIWLKKSNVCPLCKFDLMDMIKEDDNNNNDEDIIPNEDENHH